MPASGSGIGAYPRSRQGESRTRLGTRDSNSHSYIRGDRGRSGSPTEYYRHQISKKDGISNRVYDLNVFIHKGIEKFLDKQAVRDLIIEYDSEDIYIGGADMFFAHFADEMNEAETVNFSRSEKKRFLDVLEKINAKTDVDYPHKNHLATPNGQQAAAMREAAKLQNKTRSKASPWSKPRSSLWNAFFSAIRIKVFNIHFRTKSALRKRRVSDIFAEYP